MKQLMIVSLLVLVIAGCTVTKKSKPSEFRITVTDKNNNSRVDSAMVVLTAIVDSRDVYEYIRYTDAAGRCNFSLDYKPLAQYQVRSIKKGFIGYYDKSYIDLDRSISPLNEKTGNTIDLYLTSDSFQQRNFWASCATRYDIDSLIHLLSSNSYPLRSEFPIMQWEDIDELLAIGNSRTVINKYPISVLSSSVPKDCYLGIVALWFIESVRITELKKTMNPNLKFPSLTPSLHSAGNKKQQTEINSPEMMEQAFLAYKKWWTDIKSTDKDHGCNIDPLKNTNLVWK